MRAFQKTTVAHERLSVSLTASRGQSKPAPANLSTRPPKRQAEIPAAADPTVRARRDRHCPERRERSILFGHRQPVRDTCRREGTRHAPDTAARAPRLVAADIARMP